MNDRTADTFLSLGLTPALQRTLVFEHFRVGEVNRAREIALSAAGKGVNVAMALAGFGLRAWMTGFNGGDSGRTVEADAVGRGAISALTRIRKNTRVCDTIVDQATGKVTELVEEAPPISAADLARFQKAALALERRCVGLAISGTVPPALAQQNIYVPFAELAERRQIPWVIDSHRGDLLSVLHCHPLVAKMNRHELEVTFGQACASDAMIVEQARRLTAGGARHAFITDGARPSWLVSADGKAWKLIPPDVDRVVNPIGSGDCVTAAMLAALWQGKTALQAARLGLACGSANTVTLIPALFEMKLVEKLRKATVAERIS